MAISKTYVTKIESSVTANAGAIPNQLGYEDGEWEARIIRCSRRLLSAVVFREMAQVSLSATGSSLLPTIGFYYALFHAGVAMLCIECTTSLTEVSYGAKGRNPNEPGVTHKKVRRLLQERLVDPGVLDGSYVRQLDDLKKLREFVNYAVGGRIPHDNIVETLDEAALYDQVGMTLALATSVIKEIASYVVLDRANNVTGVDRIRSTIGDHFGDDLVHLYVPREHRSRVWDYLVAQSLTT